MRYSNAECAERLVGTADATSHSASVARTDSLPNRFRAGCGASCSRLPRPVQAGEAAAVPDLAALFDELIRFEIELWNAVDARLR
jgi:hypothetical protein